MPVTCYTYDFEVRRGDTWDGADVSILVNSIPLDLSGATIRMGFGKRPGVEEFFLTSPADITITSPLTGDFRIEKHIFNTAGVFYHEVQITLASSDVKTYLRGKATIKLDIAQ